MGALVAVAVVAAGVTALVVPWVARLARRVGAVAWRVDEGPGGSDPAVPVPALGGLGMFVGLLAALGVAAVPADLARVIGSTSELLAVAVGAAGIVVLGFFDDTHRLAPLVKLGWQLVIATAVTLLGVRLVHFWLPGIGVIALSADLGLVLTVLALVTMVNAVNLIDGLDGLAATVVAIGATAFLVLSLAGRGGSTGGAVTSVAALVALMTASLALGFLVHNWYPARSFMGDTGSMLLGLLLGTAGVSYVGRTGAPTGADFVGAVPLFVPVLVLAVPFADSAFAVARRLLSGRPITARDDGHVHHLLLRFGHSHRRAVVVLAAWSTVVASLAVAPTFLRPAAVVVLGVGASAVAALVTLLGTRVRAAR